MDRYHVVFTNEKRFCLDNPDNWYSNLSKKMINLLPKSFVLIKHNFSNIILSCNTVSQRIRVMADDMKDQLRKNVNTLLNFFQYRYRRKHRQYRFFSHY